MISKKTTLFAAAAVMTIASLSNAALVVDDTFAYANGNLSGNDAPIGGVWAGHSGTGSLVQVASGAISIVHGSGSREDVNVPFEGGAAAGTGAVLTASFDLSVPAITATITDAYFAHFLMGTSAFSSRIWITAPTVGGTGYRLALSNFSAIGGAGVVFSDNLAFDTVYDVVSTYAYDSTTGTLSVNGSTPLTSTDAGASINASTAYAFRQAGGNTTQVIDNLTVDLVVVPEPTTLGLLAGMGVIALRRRSGR